MTPSGVIWINLQAIAPCGVGDTDGAVDSAAGTCVRPLQACRSRTPR